MAYIGMAYIWLLPLQLRPMHSGCFVDPDAFDCNCYATKQRFCRYVPWHYAHCTPSLSRMQSPKPRTHKYTPAYMCMRACTHACLHCSNKDARKMHHLEHTDGKVCPTWLWPVSSWPVVMDYRFMTPYLCSGKECQHVPTLECKHLAVFMVYQLYVRSAFVCPCSWCGRSTRGRLSCDSCCVVVKIDTIPVTMVQLRRTKKVSPAMCHARTYVSRVRGSSARCQVITVIAYV